MSVLIRVGCILATLLAIGAGASGCGQWTPPTPAGPSELPSALNDIPVQGATIAGTVNGGGVGASASRLNSASGMTVTVVGTSISAPVSSSGGFVLKGVPTGTFDLRFTGVSVDASVRITNIGDRERIEIKVRVEATRASIEASVRIRIDDSAEIEGPVTEVSGTCPSLRAVVGDWTVNLNPNTEGGCSDIKVGIKIKVVGSMRGNRTVVVVRIQIVTVSVPPPPGRDNDDDDDDDDDDD